MRKLFFISNALAPRKLLLLVVTGAPGLQRLAFISALSFFFAVTDVGEVASDLGVASFLALFAGGAVSGQIMALWGRYPDTNTRIVLRREELYWQFGALLVASALSFGLDRWGFISSPCAVLLFFAGFSLWQVERTKLISDRKLGLLASIEVGLVVLIVLGVALPTNPSTTLGFYGVSLLVAGVAIAPVAVRGLNAQMDDVAPKAGSVLGYKKTGVLAVNGLISTGREQLTIPIVKLIADAGVAGVVAQVMTVVAALLLLPRALANNYVPDMSRQPERSPGESSVLRQYKRVMRWVLAGITAALLLGVLVALVADVPTNYLLIALLAGFALIAGQFSLFPSTVLIVRQAVIPIMISAVSVTLAWVVVVVILAAVKMDGQMAVGLLLGFSVLAAVLRALYLNAKVNSRIEDHPNKKKTAALT